LLLKTTEAFQKDLTIIYHNNLIKIQTIMKKRRIYLLGVIALTASMMHAQSWEAPKISPADYAAVKMSTSIVGDTTIYYLYNIEGKGFMTNGRADAHTGQTWDTHAVLGNQGNKIIMSKYEIEGEWDGKTVYIIDYHSDAWKKVFAVHESNMFMDYADQSDAYPVWEMETEDGNVYKFKVSTSNPATFTQTMESLKDVSYMGFDIYDEDYVSNGYKALTPMIDVLSDEKIDDACIRWAFIPEDTYNSYQNALENYNAAKKLEVYLNEVKEQYPDVDLTDPQTTYNNINSTAAELNAALNQLKEDVYNYRIGVELIGATQADPRNATSFISNPDFETGNSNGWDITIGSTNASGFQGDSYTNEDVTISNFIQVWRPSYNVDSNTLGDGKMYTTVKNMPAGKYKIACDAIVVFQKAGAPKVKGAFMYVKSGDEVNMKREVATEDQKPQHFEMTFAISEQRDIELGFRTESSTASWIAADNFTLTYFGEVTDPNQAILDGLVEQYENEFGDIDDVFANKIVKESFIEEISKSKEIAEGFEVQIEILKTAYQNLLASIEDYKTLKTSISDCQDYQEALENSFPELANILADNLMEMESKYEDGEADTDYCENISSQIYQKVAQYIAEYEKQGDEVTALIFNPNFNKGNTGWTWNPKNSADVKAMNTGNPVVTAYGTTYDCSQTISGLKPGIYKLTIQGYYRTTSESDAYSEYLAGNVGEICAEVYVNNISCKLMNAFDDYYDQELSSGSFQYEEGKWAPASSGDIAKAFGNRTDIYVNTVYGYVLEDGKLTIGVRQYSADRNACYSTFDNFHLYYAGVDPVAVSMVTDKLQEEADALSNMVMSQEARNNMNSAIAAIKASSEEDIMTCIGIFFTSIETAKASSKLHEELITAYESLNTTVLENEGIASQAKMDDASAVLQQLTDASTNGCATDEDCRALINRAGKAATAFKLPDGVASEDTPIDYSCLMANPDLEQDTGNSDKNVPGWDYGSCNGYKKNTFSSFGAASHLYQTLNGLPAGKYVIEAQGLYRAGDCEGDANRYNTDPDADRLAYVFGTTSEGTVKATLMRNSDCATEEKLHADAKAVTIGGKTMYTPYSTGSCVAYFDAGYYITRIEVIVPEDGRLELGIDKPEYISNDYMNINYVHLIYYGPVIPEGIDDITTGNKTHKGIYNLQGQRLSTPQRGINIINGKKILMK